jgi:hypothetical protein
MAEDIGGKLCILVGNLMLEDMDKGKLLGEQLRPMFSLCQAKAGITFHQGGS